MPRSFSAEAHRTSGRVARSSCSIAMALGASGSRSRSPKTVTDKWPTCTVRSTRQGRAGLSGGTAGRSRRCVSNTRCDRAPDRRRDHAEPVLDSEGLWVHGGQNGPSIPIPYGSTGEYVAGFVDQNEDTPRGSVHYRLYANSSCSATSLVFDGGSGAARLFGSSGWEFSRSRAIGRMLAPGHYYWQLSYSGAPGTLSGVTGYLASLGRCGTSVLTGGPAIQINGPITRAGPPGTVEETANCLRGSCRSKVSLWTLHAGHAACCSVAAASSSRSLTPAS